jgi:hypothetical protein
MKRISIATIAAGLLSAASLLAVQQAHAQETCPLTLEGIGELSPGQVQVGDTSFGIRDVDFTAFVGNASLDLVGTDVTDVTLDTTFAIESAPECTGRPSIDGQIVGDSRFDDVIRFCGVLSVPESLIGAIGILGTPISEEICVP